MRNMMEQKKVVLPVIIALITLVIFAALVLVALSCMLPEPSGFLLTLREYVINYYEMVPSWLVYVILAVAFLLLVVLPVTVMAIRIANRYAPSPYPEGLDLTRLNDEQYRIYCDLHEFLHKGGFQIYPGYEQDCVYVNNVLFCTITKQKKAIYVNINKDMRRYDGRLDRSGYIAVHHLGGLPTAKERIYSIYKEYFQQFRKEEPQQPKRMAGQNGTQRPAGARPMGTMQQRPMPRPAQQSTGMPRQTMPNNTVKR